MKTETLEPRAGYCWCDMCGFVRRVPAERRAEVDDDFPCPSCHEQGDYTSLSTGDELAEHVIPDAPLLIFKHKNPHHKTK